MSTKSEVTAEMLTGPLVGDRVRCLCGCGMVGELLEVTEHMTTVQVRGRTYRVARSNIEVLCNAAPDVAPSEVGPW